MLQEAYEFNKSLYNDKVYSWYSFALNIQPYSKIEYSIKMKFKQIIHVVYTNQVFNKLSFITDSSKLFRNGPIKYEIKLYDNL